MKDTYQRHKRERKLGTFASADDSPKKVGPLQTTRFLNSADYEIRYEVSYLSNKKII